MKIELSNNNWVEFRDVETVTNAERKAIVRKHDELADADGLLRTMEFYEYVASLFITSWSFEAPSPNEDITALDTVLTYKDYDVIYRAALEVERSLFIDFSPTPEADSPTQP